MPTGKAPIELDKHISGPIELDEHITNKKPERKKKQKKIPWALVAGIIGLLFIVMLLFINPPGAVFLNDAPPEEQAERDSIYSVATRIEEYESIHGMHCNSVYVP